MQYLVSLIPPIPIEFEKSLSDFSSKASKIITGVAVGATAAALAYKYYGYRSLDNRIIDCVRSICSSPKITGSMLKSCKELTILLKYPYARLRIRTLKFTIGTSPEWSGIQHLVATLSLLSEKVVSESLNSITSNSTLSITASAEEIDSSNYDSLSGTSLDNDEIQLTLSLLSIFQKILFNPRNCQILHTALPEVFEAFMFYTHPEIRLYALSTYCTFLSCLPSEIQSPKDAEPRNPLQEVIEGLVDRNIFSMVLDLFKFHASDFIPEIHSSFTGETISNGRNKLEISQSIASYCLQFMSISDNDQHLLSLPPKFFGHTSFGIICHILNKSILSSVSDRRIYPIEDAQNDLPPELTNSLIRDTLIFLGTLPKKNGFMNTRHTPLASKTLFLSLLSQNIVSNIFNSNQEILYAASLCLSSFPENPPKVLFEFGRQVNLHHQVIDILLNESLNTPTYSALMNALFRLTRLNYVVEQFEDQLEVLIPKLLSLITTQTIDQDLCNIIQATGNISGRTKLGRVLFRKLGGLKILVSRLYSPYRVVRKASAYALTHFAIDDDNVLEIVSYGGLDGALSMCEEWKLAPLKSHTFTLSDKQEIEAIPVRFAIMLIRNCTAGIYSSRTIPVLIATRRLNSLIALAAHPSLQIRRLFDSIRKLLSNKKTNPDSYATVGAQISDVIEQFTAQRILPPPQTEIAKKI